MFDVKNSFTQTPADTSRSPGKANNNDTNNNKIIHTYTPFVI